MKNKFLSVLLIAFVVISLAACSEDKSADQNNDVSASGYLYAPGTTLKVICPDARLYDYADELLYAVSDNMTTVPSLVIDAGGKASGGAELVVGITEREISKNAYKCLADLESENKYEIPYLVYSDGKSVAIAYTQDDYGYNVALAKAVEAFINYMGNSESLEIKKGNLLAGFVDPLVYQETLDAKMVASRWDTLKAGIKTKLQKEDGPFRDENGKEVSKDEYINLVVSKLQDLYSLYTDDVISWFANLYEPNGGGYYFSNSARNTVGYLPDIESTWQACNFIVGSGMAKDYDEAIPDWMKAQLISFVKGLQYPNGFFYHPQWGKELTDNKISRRSRDLEWAGGLLSRLGAKPTYDTPSGIKGDGILADGTKLPEASSALTKKLSSTVALPVSKIAAVDSSTAVIPDNLKTEQAFREYLDAIDIRNNCYGGGNELGTQASQFKARDEQARKEGWSPVEMVIEYLNDNCYATTGHWSSVADYNGTNGLLKISGLYNSLEAEMPYPLEAAKSAISSITTNERAETICYVYNAWYSVGNIVTNLKNYSTKANKDELANDITSSLLADCVSGIAASIEKTLTFRRDDGSFSYLTTGSSTNSQGMPVAVPRTLEGDVNATEIGIVGTAGWIFSALGLSSYQPPIYTTSDLIRYHRILKDLGPVIKDPEDNTININNFDDEAVGYDPEYIELDFKSSGSAKVAKVLCGTKEEKVLQFKSVNNGGDTLTFACDSMRANASCYVFDFDMCVNSATSGNFLQVVLGSKAYMLMFSNDSSGIHMSDISYGSTPRLMNDFGVTLDFGEWYKFKIEYYVGSEDSVRIKVYVDGEVIGVTDNYYDSTGARLKGKEGNPSTSYTEASILALSYVNTDILFDNLACYKTNTIYQAMTDPDNQPNINIDAPVTGTVTQAPGMGTYFNDPLYAEYKNKFTYDFMGYPSPSFTGPAWGKMVSQNGMLNFERVAPSGSGETYIQYILAAPTDLTAYKNYCSVYEFDYRVSEADLSNDNAPFRLDDANYIRFVKNSDGKTWSLGTPDTAKIEAGKWANIRFEIYYVNEYTEIAKVFVDGEFATEVRLSTMSPFNSRLCIYMKKNIEKGTVINIDNMIILHLDKAHSEEAVDEVDMNIADAPASGTYYNGEITENANRWSFATGTSPSLSGINSVAYVKDCRHLLFLKTVEGSEANISFQKSAPTSFTDMAYTVIEFDFYANKITAGSAGMLFRFDDNNYAYFVANDDGESFSIGTKNTAKIKENTWHNIRFEIYYRSVVTAEIWVDGVKTEAVINITDATAFTSRLLVYTKSSTEVNSFLALDNIFFGHMTKPSDEVIETETVTAPESTGKFYNSTESFSGSSKRLDFNTLTNSASLNSNAAVAKSVNGVGKYQLTDSTAETFIKLENTSAPTTSEYITISEFDMFFSGYDVENMESYPYYFMPIRIYDASGNNEYIRFVKNSDGTLSIDKAETVKIESDKWYNVRFEFVYTESGIELDIYVNDTYVTTKALTKAVTTVTKTWITLNKRIYNSAEDAEQGAVYLDNLFFGHIDTNPTKDRTSTGGDETQTPEGGETVTPEIPTGYQPGNGKFYNDRANITGGSVSVKDFNATTTGIGVNNSNGTSKVVKGVSEFNMTAASDSYIRIENTTAPTDLTEYITVSEFDIKFSGFDISAMKTAGNYPYYFAYFRIYNGNDSGANYIRFVLNDDGETLSLGTKNTAEIKMDEWFNIRFEIVYNEDGSAEFDIYINGEFATTVKYDSFVMKCGKTWICANSKMYKSEAGAEQGTIYLDNIYYGHISSEYKTEAEENS